MNIEKFTQVSFRNRSLIKPDGKVSCFYCRTTYLGKYITEWTDEGMTAICPCGIDSVVPYEVDQETLNRAHDRWFGYDDDTIEKYKDSLKNDCMNVPGVNFIEGD
jgi:hypothetical protein